MAPRHARALGMTLAGLLVVGCSVVAPSDPPASPGGSAPPDPAMTMAPAVTVGPPPSPTPGDPTSPLAIDAALLAFLPADVAGAAVTESLDEATLALGSPVLQEVASAIDAAVAVDLGSGDLVYALVVRLRPGQLGPAAYRDWRDSYDEGACSAAGVVIGHAEAEIDGRPVHIGTCEGGLRTYHVVLEEEGILISASSLGERRFGELLVSNLQTGD